MLCFLASCSDKSESANYVMSSVETSVSDSLGEPPTIDSKQVGNRNDKNVVDSKRAESNSAAFLLYLSLFTSILSFILFIILFRLRFRCSDLFGCEEFLKHVNKAIEASSTNPESSIYRILNDRKETKISQPFNLSRDIEIIVERIIENKVDLIVDRVMECVKLNLKEIESNLISVPVSEIKPTLSDLNSSYLYASTVDIQNNCFYKTTFQLDEDSVYKLTVSGENAVFEVYEGAFEKVLQAPDCLKGACKVHGFGNNKVINEKEGATKKQADGTWIITSKANIKFE